MRASSVLLERVEAKRTELCVIERRNAAIWVRRGPAGGKGRITRVLLADETEAASRFAAEVSARLAEGFVVTDVDRTVSGPFRAHAAKKRALRLDPREVATRIVRGLPAFPAPFANVFDALCTGARVETIPRLARIEASGEEGGDVVFFALTYARGSGENVDDYDLDVVGFAIALDGVWPGESDGVELDIFVDELRRVRGAALVERFEKAVQQLPLFPELARTLVTRVDREEA